MYAYFPSAGDDPRSDQASHGVTAVPLALRVLPILHLGWLGARRGPPPRVRRHPPSARLA